jgi:hypothetical protein
MIDIEKFWVPENFIIPKNDPDISFYRDMNKNGWRLIESHGNLFRFFTHIWEWKEENDTFLLQVGEEDLLDFFVIPDKLQFFVKIWVETHVPQIKGRRDYCGGKWQYHVDFGWFDEPHICKGVPCNQCLSMRDKHDNYLDLIILNPSPYA